MPNTSKDLFNLAEKFVVVTGSASGIGAGISELLAQSGPTVVIADINIHQAEAQTTKLRDAGFSATAVNINMAEEAPIGAACAEITSRFGTPWALINNAGVQDRQLLLEATASE